MTTAASTVTMTVGGLPRDLISSKWFFFSYLTFSRVISNDRLASATASSAYFASYIACSYYFYASFSSMATNYC